MKKESNKLGQASPTHPSNHSFRLLLLYHHLPSCSFLTPPTRRRTPPSFLHISSSSILPSHHVLLKTPPGRGKSGVHIGLFQGEDTWGSAEDQPSGMRAPGRHPHNAALKITPPQPGRTCDLRESTWQNAASGVHWVKLGTISGDLTEPWQSRTERRTKSSSDRLRTPLPLGSHQPLSLALSIRLGGLSLT